MNVLKLLFLLPLFFTITVQQSSSKPSLWSPHFVNSLGQNSGNDTIPQQYFEVTLPLLTDDSTPACSVTVLTESFGNTSGSPPVSVNYTPPESTCKWSHAVLEFRAECKGVQHDRIAGVWIDGIELLRTSTAQPTDDGIFWTVRKDVTRYSSVLTRNNLTLCVMLENLVNDEFTGVYNVNVSFHFYYDKASSSFVSEESEAHKMNRNLISVKSSENEYKLGLDRVTKSIYRYDTPADSIIPISGSLNEGYWFRIHGESEIRSTNVQISEKTYKAVLELYVSFHGDDEFWYMNPPSSYVQANDLSTGAANGAYREVLVTIDGKLIGTVIPFPVIFTGGINHLFWQPVVSIGAFDLPSYDIDFTPVLGLLLDNQNHSIGFQIAEGTSFWLVDANLHIWLDHSHVQAIVEYEAPSMEIEKEYEFEGLEGEFEIEIERKSKAIGWVQSNNGILETRVTEEINFSNKIKFKDGGTRKELDHRVKTKTKIEVTDEKGHTIRKMELQKEYPLKITIETQPISDKSTFRMNTTIVQGRSESFVNEEDSISRVLSHDQNCTGSIMVTDKKVVSGSTQNHQNYDYKDESGCYSRKVDVVNGAIVADRTSSVCTG